jgi:hypothetical protein
LLLSVALVAAAVLLLFAMALHWRPSAWMQRRRTLDQPQESTMVDDEEPGGMNTVLQRLRERLRQEQIEQQQQASPKDTWGADKLAVPSWNPPSTALRTAVAAGNGALAAVSAEPAEAVLLSRSLRTVLASATSAAGATSGSDNPIPSASERVFTVASASVRGNLGAPARVLEDSVTDWLRDRWQAAADMGGSPLPLPVWLRLDFREVKPGAIDGGATNPATGASSSLAAALAASIAADDRDSAAPASPPSAAPADPAALAAGHPARVCIQRLELDWEVAAAQQYTIELLLQTPSSASLNGQNSAADASATDDATAAASAAATESEQWLPIYSTSSGHTRETSPKHVLHSIEQDELVRFTAAALTAANAAPSPSSTAAAVVHSPSPSPSLAADPTRGGLPCGTALRLTVQRNGTPWGSSLWQVRVFGWAM